MQRGDNTDAQSFNMSSISHARTEKDNSEIFFNRQEESSKINELTSGSLSIKGNLVHKGRCPKCTLKPPCKHFQTIDELP